MINCIHLSIILLHLTVKGQKWKMKKSNVPEVENLTSEIERVHRIQWRKIFHQWRKNSSRVHCVLGKNETGWSPLRSILVKLLNFKKNKRKFSGIFRHTCVHVCVHAYTHHTHTQCVTYKGEKEKASWPKTPSVTFSGRRQWSNVYNILRERKCNPRI